MTDTISLETGETIRHRMSTRAVVDRILNQEPKIIEVMPDPTDGARVLIRALSAGTAHIDLTDANGVKEKYTVRVR